MQRIQIIGPSGAGKTTLGRALAARHRLPFIDLDDLWWEPGWVGAGHEAFARRLEPRLAAPGWVIAGNYHATTDEIVWPRLDALIILDLPFSLVLRRVVLRTLLRGLRGTPCCNGNRESVLRFFHRDGLVRYLVRTWASSHARYATLAAHPRLAHARVIRLSSAAEASRFVA